MSAKMSAKDRIRSFLNDYFTVMGKSRKDLPAVLIMMLCATALDVLAVASIGPFVSVVLRNDVQLGGQLLSLSSAGRGNFMAYGAGIVLLFLAKAALTVMLTKRIYTFSEGRKAELVRHLHRGYLLRPVAYHLKFNTSELITRVIYVTSSYANTILAGSLRLVADSIIAIALMAFLLIVDWRALLLLILALGSVSILVAGFVRPRLLRSSTNMWKAAEDITKNVQQSLGGLREVRILGREQYFMDQLAVYARNSALATAQTTVYTMLPRASLEAAVVCFLVALSWVVLYFDRNSTTLFTLLGVFAVAGIRLMPAATSILTSFTAIRSIRPQLSLLAADLKALASEEALIIEAPPAAAEPFRLLSANNLTYRYAERTQPALDGISFEIRAGEVIGVMGKSGAGKSTLADVVLGLLDCENGTLQVNDFNAFAEKSRWRQMVAYIPQTVFLLDDSMRRNIAFGIPDAEIDEARVQQVVMEAQLGSLVSQSPEGLDTVLGERGVRLSGGQRQRIAIARALYHNRDFLILDEATSALDAETEREIVSAIGALQGRKTLLVIAHKASVLADADRILHIDNGRISLIEGRSRHIAKSTLARE